MPDTFRGGTKLNGAFVWRDLIGNLAMNAVGGGSPTLDEWNGGIARVPFFALNDIATTIFHVPHDYVPGSDLYVHLHWGHNGTAISGNFVATLGVSYAKGHNQANFATEIAPVISVATPDIATVPRWRHRIDEIQLSAASPTATQLDSDDIEVDGMIILGVKLTTMPAITGGTPNNPAIILADIHYLSNNIGTKNKVPDFYT